MSAEKIVEGLGKQISRRAFLAKVGTATVATLLALLGFPRTASGTHGEDCPSGTVHYKCCCLCFNPSGPCSSGCPTSSHSGQWCWTCYDSEDELMYKCCECKQINAACNSTCNGVVSSSAQPILGAPRR